MSTDKHKTITRSPGRKLLGVISTLTFVGLLLATTVGMALAVHDAGLFELDVRAGVAGDQAKQNDPIPALVGDGNTVDDPNMAGDDWATIYADYMDGTPAGDNSGAFAISWVEDTFANGVINGAAEPWVSLRTPENSFFTGGGSKDTNGIQDGPWLYGAEDRNDVVPDKNDIVNAFAAAYDDPDNGTIFYFGLDTFSVNGDANAGFWFFRKPVGLNPLTPGASTGTFYGEHSDGDIFVAVAYTQGGTVGTIDVYEWVGDDATGGLVLKTTGLSCAVATAGDDVCGVINKLLPGQTFGEDPVFDYANTLVSNNPTSPSSYQYESAAFVEFGLDIEAILGQEIGCFSTFMAETRSSQSASSQLKDFAFGEFKVCGIDVTKTGDSLSKATDPVDYTVTIENTGRVTLYKRNISDTLLGSITDNGVDQENDYVLSNTCDADLAPNESCTITLQRTVLAGDPDPLPNTVTALYSEYADFTGLEFSDYDDHSVNLFQPAVMIAKDGTTLSKVTDDATYTFTITNMSTEDSPDMELASVNDNVLGDLTSQAITAGCDVLTYQEECTFDVTRTIVEGDPDPLSNHVRALYHPAGFSNDIRASDGHAVNLFQPSVSITKSGNTLSKIGDPVTYHFRIENTSSADSPNLVLDSIVDDVLGDLASYATGCLSLPPVDDPATLDVEENVCEFDVPWTVAAVDVNPADGEDDDPVINTVVIHFHPDGFPNDISATGSHELNLFQPSITFEKTADTELSKVGDVVNYTLTLNNTSSPDTPALTCTIVDTVLGINTTVTLPEEDDSPNSHVITQAFTVPGGSDDPYTNNASVMCTVGGGFGNMLDASDTWTVNLFQPSVSITKSGNTLSKIGDEVTYHFKITNTSSSDSPVLKLDSVSDDVLGSLLAVATANGCDNLAPGATCEFDVPWTVAAVDISPVTVDPETGETTTGDGIPEDPIVNTVTVHYHPLGFLNDITDSDDHSLDLFTADFSITKTGDTLSKVGDEVKYTFTIVNLSSSDAPNLVLNSLIDDRIGNLKLATGYNIACEELVYGETCTFDVYWTIPEGALDPYVNTVSVEYQVDGFPNKYSHTDDHSVDLFQASIELTKTGTPLSKIGDPVDYVITLENNSSADTPALTCTVTDATVGVDETFSVASGLDHVINVTDLIVPADADDPFVNTANVTCTPAGFGNIYTDSASWETNLFQPSINIVKTGDAYSKNWGKQADTITYYVTIYNTSSDDTPNMSLVSYSDARLPADFVMPEDCEDLGYLESCSFSYTYTPTEAEGEGDTLVNTFNAVYNPDGFPNQISDGDGSNTWTVTLLHPSFTVAKFCASDEPVPQEGPALFDIVITNTGDVELVITADDGVGTFNLAADASQTFSVSVPGSFSGQATVENTVTASWVLPEMYGLSNTASASATGSCRVGSRVNVLKLTQGQVDPSQSWTFSIWQGADGFGGTKLASSSTSGDPDGVLDFGNLNLDRLQTYTLCEEGVPAGWTSFWQVDTDGDGVADTTVIPYNPNADDDPPDDVGNRCVDIGAGTGIDLLTDGGTLVFQVNNTYPGGEPRTPGYWKNWNRCTGGGQQYTADENGGWQAGFWLLEDVLDPNIGGGIVWDDILADDFDFPIQECAVAVDILDQRDVADPTLVGDGAKHSSDAAYTLAMHLLAAQLNFGAGAKTCDAAFDAALAGEELLDRYNFNGTGDYLLNNNKKTKVDYNKALELANTLDLYNNGELCVGPAVSFVAPLDNDVLDGTSYKLEVSVLDMVAIGYVDFYVDGNLIGTDNDIAGGWTWDWDLTVVADGNHELMAVATNIDGQPGSANVVVVVDNVPDPVLPTMHVGALSATVSSTKTGKWNVIAAVTIHDASHIGLSGAVVSLMWGDGATATCTTGADGTCTVTRNNINSNVASLTLDVMNVAEGGHIYDADLNEVTSITVNKP